MTLTDKVALNNVCSWPLYFRRANGVGDIRVPANAKNFSMLDAEEIRMQIQLDNNLFTGTNPSRPGEHARIVIVDTKVRNELFGLSEEDANEILVLDDTSVRELLAIKTKKEFGERLQALVTTDAEKKMIIELAKAVGGDDGAAWKMEAINALAETATI